MKPKVGWQKKKKLVESSRQFITTLRIYYVFTFIGILNFNLSEIEISRSASIPYETGNGDVCYTVSNTIPIPSCIHTAYI